MTLVGIHQKYSGKGATTLDKTLETYPLTEITCEFKGPDILKPQNLIPFVMRSCKDMWDRDLIVTWSVKLDVASVLSGQWRPYLEQLADYVNSMVANEHFIFVPWHEPENDFATPEQWVKYFNTIHDTVKAINPNLKTCHAALGYRYADNGGRNKITDATAARWRTKADINAVDLYSGRSFPLTSILPELSGFKRWLKFVVQDDAWAVRERGFVAKTGQDEQDRARTMRREANWLTTSPEGERCLWVILWDTSGTEDDEGLLFDDPDAQDAARYYMTQVAPVTTPTPEPSTPEPIRTTTCPVCHGTGQVPNNQSYTVVTTIPGA